MLTEYTSKRNKAFKTGYLLAFLLNKNILSQYLHYKYFRSEPVQRFPLSTTNSTYGSYF